MTQGHKVSVEKVKEGDHFNDVGEYGRVILKSIIILKTQCERISTGFIGCR
jgi:hypothetical protein